MKSKIFTYRTTIASILLTVLGNMTKKAEVEMKDLDVKLAFGNGIIRTEAE